MNLAFFKSRSVDQRADIVWDRGVLLASCDKIPFSSCLYYLYDFFAEIWYETESCELIFVRGFQELTELEPYLEQISLQLTLDT